MLDSTLRSLNYRLQSPCMGDLRVRELIDYYFEKRNIILGYKGKSAVDKDKLIKYESKLIEDSYNRWFSHYTKEYLDRVLWLLRRLKVDITPLEEYQLISSYYDRMPISELMFSRYDKTTLAADKELMKYFKDNNIIK